MEEHVEKSIQTADLLVSNLIQVLRAASSRPEGKTMGDKAIASVLMGLIDAAQEIKERLRSLL